MDDELIDGARGTVSTTALVAVLITSTLDE